MPRLQLLVIDPQNDFMDIAGAALPVTGASADMDRLAGLLDGLQSRIGDIVVTLDSHPGVGIERTTFWVAADGTAVAPFTMITAAQARAGDYRPRDPARRSEVLDYLDALEAASGRTLIVWPVHCVLGTWGHAVQSRLADSIAQWEFAHARNSQKVLKGQNPLTEQYSAFRAEVPRADDPRTAVNMSLLAQLAADGATLLVAGEALSHCVAASGEDMLAHMDDSRLRNTVFLTDCMSPVDGFADAGRAFLARLPARGIRTMTAAQAVQEFGA
jgi:nicotinamidase/pyrazinamidase